MGGSMDCWMDGWMGMWKVECRRQDAGSGIHQSKNPPIHPSNLESNIPSIRFPYSSAAVTKAIRVMFASWRMRMTSTTAP